MPVLFSDFLATVPDEQREFVSTLHECLTDQGCVIKVKEAKSGYAVSYVWAGKSIMNWVFRKSGLFARIYGDHVTRYESAIAALPADMQKKMTGARDCKRLIAPPAECSDTCVMGFVYHLDGATYKKCRNDGMFFLLSDEAGPHIKTLVEAELAVRQSAIQDTQS